MDDVALFCLSVIASILFPSGKVTIHVRQKTG
jgi:hypothetical protein